MPSVILVNVLTNTNRVYTYQTPNSSYSSNPDTVPDAELLHDIIILYTSPFTHLFVTPTFGTNHDAFTRSPIVVYTSPFTHLFVTPTFGTNHDAFTRSPIVIYTTPTFYPGKTLLFGAETAFIDPAIVNYLATHYTTGVSLPAGMTFGAETAFIDPAVVSYSAPYSIYLPAPSWTEPSAAVINETTITSGTQYRNYSFQFTATGSPPFVWTITGLPTGLSYSTSTGRVTGISTQSGIFSLTVGITDRYGNTDSNTMDLTMSAGNQDPFMSGLAVAEAPIGYKFSAQGLWFGASQGSSTITVNGTTATVNSWTDTEITATVASGTTTGNVKVTVNSIDSNLISLTVV